MKIPKQVRRYCPYCKAHTIHKVIINKKRKASSLSFGSKYRAKKRGAATGLGNRGKYSKPAASKFKLGNKKVSKKTDIRYECSVCKKKHNQSKGKRAKRVEFA